jgi:hypothetical protein
MSDCLLRGVTNIRDAFSEDLRPNRLLKNRIKNGEIPGPRIQQAVVVGALGGYLTPELRGLKKILMRFLNLGKIKYEEVHSGVVDGDAFQDSSIIGKRVDALFMDGVLKIDNCDLEILNTVHPRL